MTLLLWASAIVFAGGWLYFVPAFAQSHPWRAAACWAIAYVAMAGACWIATRKRSTALATAGVVLLASAAAHLWIDPLLYLVGSRGHAIPVLSPVFAALVNLVGFDAHLGDGAVFVQGDGSLLQFTTTFEKLGLVPALWILATGGVCVLFLRKARPVRSLAWLVLGIATYLVLRYVALVVLFVHHPDPRNLTKSASPALSIFQDPFQQLLSFALLALVLCAVVPWRREELRLRPLRPIGRRALASVAFAAGAALIAASFVYQDPGERKAGRVLFDELHSKYWESVARPMDTEWYGRDSIYNYATFAAFLEQYYPVEINMEESYGDALLAQHDVLVVKTPTAPFRDEEIDAIERFVEGGGGLFLIGDHTDLLGMTTNLNKLSHRFGIEFNSDAANRLDDGQFHTFSTNPLFPHPATAFMPEFEFMTSCTLRAPILAENVMIGGNTFSDPLDYSSPSFFGNVRADSEDDFGVHQLSAAIKRGKGRVLAFADGTVFSSFGVMFRSRPEFLLGVVEYLNRRNTTAYAWNRVLLAAGIILLAAGALAAGRHPLVWALGLSVALGAGVGAGGSLAARQVRSHYRPPELSEKKPTLVFPEHWGDMHLPCALVESRRPPQKSFDTFFVWTQRLGYIPRVLPFADGIGLADAVVIVNPTHVPDAEEREDLMRFVRSGGRLLVMDSLWNADTSANVILDPFGLRLSSGVRSESNVYADEAWMTAQTGEREDRPASEDPPPLEFEGILAAPLAEPMAIPSLTVLGGTGLFATEDGRTLASVETVGKGRVIVMVDSITFSRAGMGEMVEPVGPGSSQRESYELEFRLLRDYLLGPLQFVENGRD